MVKYFQERIQSAEDGNYEETMFTKMMESLKLISDNNGVSF